MLSLRNVFIAVLALITFSLMHSAAHAADPGIPVPLDSTVNDQKPGSVLFFNYYTSGATSGNAHNTRINVTNTHPSQPAFVRLFMVADFLGTAAAGKTSICLAPNQTASFLTSDVDPGVTGYIIAVAADRARECPISFNYLVGSADVKLATGHQATLNAQAISALFTGSLPGCRGDAGAATLPFNGGPTGYDRLPRVLAVDKIPSRVDGNDTLLIFNRLGGNLSVGSETIGFFSGTLYDDAGNGYTFTSSGGRQFRTSLSNSFPSTMPTFQTAIPAGRRGWMKFSTPQSNDYALFGAIINFNPNARSDRSAYDGGQNLRALTLTSAATLTIPFLPPTC